MGGQTQVLLTEHSCVGRRQPRGAEEFHRVHHHRQARHCGQCCRQGAALHDPAHTRVETRLGTGGDREGEVRTLSPELAQIHHPQHQGQGQGSKQEPQPVGEAQQQEDVQPGRHEGVVDGPADEHKGAGHQGHAPPVPPVHQQREQKQQHPHRAGVEAIQQPHGQGEDRKAERSGADAAEAAKAHVARCTLTSIDQIEQFPASAISVIKTHKHLAFEDERGYPPGPGCRPVGSGGAGRRPRQDPTQAAAAAPGPLVAASAVRGGTPWRRRSGDSPHARTPEVPLPPLRAGQGPAKG